MKQARGFSLIEVLVAMAILVIVAAVAIEALVQAQRVTDAVALEANVQENLRAGMHFSVRDLCKRARACRRAEFFSQVRRTSTARGPHRPYVFPAAHTQAAGAESGLATRPDDDWCGP